MHIQNKQANKHYPSSDTAQRASAGYNANNNDSTWHNRMMVKYSMPPQAYYKKRRYKYHLETKQSDLRGEQNNNITATFVSCHPCISWNKSLQTGDTNPLFFSDMPV